MSRGKKKWKFLKEKELTPPFVAAVKSTREWGESGREATATLTIAQIHKYTIKQIQMKANTTTTP